MKARELISGFDRVGQFSPKLAALSTPEADLYTDDVNAQALRQGGSKDDLVSWLKAHFDRAGKRDYVELVAFIERDESTMDALQTMRVAIRDACHVATCAKFGPRFLDPTGQACKGGPNKGVLLQITTDDETDLPVPGQNITFGTIKAAQARSEFEVLAERGRRALHVHLK